MTHSRRHGTHASHGSHGSHAGTGRRGKHGEHAEKGPQWLKWVVGCVLAFAAVLLFINLTGGGSAHQEGDPTHLIAEAEKALAERQFVRAADLCEHARLQNPDAATLARLDALLKDIETKHGRERDAATLDLATRTVDAIREFNKLYPGATRSRPATRELARQCKNWLDRFRDVAKLYEDTAVLAVEVQTLYDGAAPGAGLSQPDDADDVLFQAERRLSLTAAPYREVVKSIDDYVSTHPADKKVDELKAKREAIVGQAQAAFDRHAADAQRFAAAGRIDEANKSAQAMRNAIVYDAMAIKARSVEKEIDRAAGKK